MSRLFCAFTLSVLLSIFAPGAKSQDVSVDFFYDNLNGGSWIEVGNYGYCWQPDIAVSDSSWRPYADGSWAYTDLGWTWVSYEDFGWATYHYGRWVRLADYGWVWVPGYHWAPAWVSWRFGDGYVGWAPLPPETEVVYESRPLTGHLDLEFDIGPACYNFVDVRYIGEPVLRSRIVPYQQNITCVTQTVNITNITYKNKTVYNYGPDLSVVNQHSSRPVQQLKLERQTNVDVATAAKSGGLTKVQGNALVVAAPPEIKKPATTPAPPKVKAKVDQPKIEKGWSVVGDENSKNQLKEKLKAETPKNIPPPVGGGNAATAAGASGKGKGREQFGGTGMTPAPTEAEGTSKLEGKRKGFERQNVGPTPGAPASSTESSNEPRGKPRQFEQSPSGTPPSGNQGTASGPQSGPYGEGRGRHKVEGVNVAPQGGANQGDQTGERKREGKGKGKAAASATPGPQ